MANDADPAFERLVSFVRDNRGFDFTGYKRPSLTRRFSKRMQDLGIDGYSEYQDYLEVHPEEFTHLFNTTLINVTSFFRDPAAWDFVAKNVVPRIVRNTEFGEHTRIWSVGCASGEEAYSIAMLLAEEVGLANLIDRAKIYATDVDEEALAEARSGMYDAKALASIPAALRDRYLEPAEEQFVFRKELRRALIFGRHDLVSDAPISRVDLILCRNTLMYFNADVQSKIYRGFEFALRPHGFLFLGKSEMLFTRTDMFSPVDLKQRVFVRASDGGRDEDAGLAERSRLDGDPLKDAVFESATVAQVVVDRAGNLVVANARARDEFRLTDADFERPFHELELSYRPLELRSRIDGAVSEQRSSVEKAVPWQTPSGDRHVDVEVVPLLVEGQPAGVTVTFTDVSRSFELQHELEHSRRELETAYEEIQSTVEELETTNEELQSTNEELETTNEELEAINIELRDRTSQLNHSKDYLESVLGGVRAGVVVLDSDLNVESWNKLAEDLWGLRTDEVAGKSIFALDIGLPVEELKQPIREVLAGSTDFHELRLDATNRRGKQFRCKVLVSPMRSDGDESGAILLMEADSG